MEAIGHPFDAAIFDAVGTAEVDDAERVGTVLELVENGYRIGADLLRPAKVIVGRGAAEETEATVHNQAEGPG